MPNNDTRSTCTTTLPSIFERLEALAPNDARDIRTAFEAVWENFYHLADCLQSAASRFRGVGTPIVDRRMRANGGGDGCDGKEPVEGHHA